MRISDWSSDVCSSDLAAGIEMRVRVDRIVPAPDVGVVLLERPRSAADAGVAEQDAHRPEVASLRARGGPALLAGDVELEAKRVGSLAAQGIRGGLSPGAVDVGENDCGAFRSEVGRASCRERVSVRVDLGGRRRIKKNKPTTPVIKLNRH